MSRHSFMSVAAVTLFFALLPANVVAAPANLAQTLTIAIPSGSDFIYLVDEDDVTLTSVLPEPTFVSTPVYTNSTSPSVTAPIGTGTAPVVITTGTPDVNTTSVAPLPTSQIIPPYQNSTTSVDLPTFISSGYAYPTAYPTYNETIIPTTTGCTAAANATIVLTLTETERETAATITLTENPDTVTSTVIVPPITITEISAQPTTIRVRPTITESVTITEIETQDAVTVTSTFTQVEIEIVTETISPAPSAPANGTAAFQRARIVV